MNWVNYLPRYHTGCEKFAFDAKMLKNEESAKGDKDVPRAVKKLNIAEKIATKSRDMNAVTREENNAEKEIQVQCSPFITLRVGVQRSGTYVKKSKLCYKETILERNYRKMTSYFMSRKRRQDNNFDCMLKNIHL